MGGDKLLPSQGSLSLKRRHLITRGLMGGAAVALGGAASPSASIAYATAPTSTGEYNLRDFGAVGDNTTDDGPALQAALNELAGAGGGTLVIPAGKYLIRSPVLRDFNYATSSIRLRGMGSSSQFRLATGRGTTAIALQNIYRVELAFLTFVGTTGVLPDVRRGLAFFSCDLVIMRGCQLFGVSAVEAGGGAIYSYATDLRMEACASWGCTGGTANQVPVVENENWIGLHIEDCVFWDSGELNGILYSKTGASTPYAWVAMGEPREFQGSSSQREVHLVRVSMDEGAYRGFEIWPFGSVRAQHVYIDGLQVNGFTAMGGVGASLKGTEKVTIERSWFGYSVMSTNAINLVDAGDVVLNEIKCGSGMTTISADAQTRSLTLLECDYGTLNSSAVVTNVIKGGRRIGPVNFKNVPAPATGPSDGGLLYVEGGALKYRGSNGTLTTIAKS